MATEETRMCNKCHIEKPIKEYGYRNDAKLYKRDCSQCEWVARKCYIENLNPARKEALRKYNQNKARRHYHKNKERRKESSRLWKKRNPEYAANYSRQYLKDNRDKINEFAKKYIKIRRKIDVNFRFALQIRGRIRQALKTQRSYKTNTTFKLIGCNLAELKNHLEALFTEGMAWDNYGYSGWQIDHIIPCASFDLTDPEQQKVCFHFSNLQPLWAEDNLKKGAKVG